ncbi:hypothetical protein ACFL5K_02195 [Gemmatimonadota bacterium]
MNSKLYSFGVLALTIVVLISCGRQADAPQQAAADSAQKATDGWAVGVYTGKSPFELGPPAGVANPVISPHDVTDMQATIVAHPFLVTTDSLFYMFFTVKNPDLEQGGIGLASSADGLNWKYHKMVVKEAYYLAYPQVFQRQGQYYMIPEAYTETAVRLYRATSFPDRWVYEKDLLAGDNFISSTVFQHDGMWWMFVGRLGNETLRLFHAEQPLGQWTEHPQSPIIEKNLDTARPAGTPFVYQGELYRVGQDCAPTYGNKVHAFRITRLTTTEYAEEMVQEPIFTMVPGSWTAQGANHVDARQLADGKWIAAVDGLGH